MGVRAHYRSEEEGYVLGMGRVPRFVLLIGDKKLVVRVLLLPKINICGFETESIPNGVIP